MKLLENKVALVTGAGQGVGQGIALALAQQGAKLAITGRTEEKLHATAEIVRQSGGEAIVLVCDIKSSEAIDDCVDTVVSTWGTVDILVNNAMEVPSGTLLGVSEEKFTAGWESGPLATLRMMKACHPHLRGGGSIINLGSAASKRWDASGYGLYAAVKEAIRSISKAAACEWGADGIRTNVILPLASSPGLAYWMDKNPEEAAEYLASIPMQRVGDCEKDIGGFVVSLCTEFSAYVNGQTIALDGGQAYLG